MSCVDKLFGRFENDVKMSRRDPLSKLGKHLWKIDLFIQIVILIKIIYQMLFLLNL